MFIMALNILLDIAVAISGLNIVFFSSLRDSFQSESDKHDILYQIGLCDFGDLNWCACANIRSKSIEGGARAKVIELFK